MGWFKRFLSRKFLVAVGGMIVTSLVGLGLPPEVAVEVSAMLVSLCGVYILGQSWVDGRIVPDEFEEFEDWEEGDE